MTVYDYNTGKPLEEGQEQSVFNIKTGQKIGTDTYSADSIKLGVAPKGATVATYSSPKGESLVNTATDDLNNLQTPTTEVKTDKRKKVRQASRAVLTNEAEAIIVATGNARAWRHIINMRASEHAEIQIRRPIFKAYLSLKEVEPISFSDFEVMDLSDGTQAVRTAYPKV